MEYLKTQQKIDELDDWIRSNPGHHQLQQANANKTQLKETLETQILEIEVTNPEQL